MRYRLLVAALLLPAVSAAAQGQTGAASTTPPPPAAAAPTPPARAGWYSDRRPIRVGDLITVYIDERTSASERISTVARNDRSQDMGFDATFAPEALKNVGIGFNARSNQTGTADRRGDFTAALTVRVTEIESGGAIKVQGTKSVNIDKRAQLITLSGVVRPDDIAGGNAVLSTRIAEAVITYQGKNISPKSGLFGKILGALWP